MAGGKETGRQKMIGMMYLVLTALLAMNVSKDIIEAFVMINDGIVETNESFSSKINYQYQAFEASYNKNPAKAGKYWNKAKELKSEADEVVDYISTLKALVLLNSSLSGTPPQQIPDLPNHPNFGMFIAPGPNGEDTVLNVEYYEKKDEYDSPLNLLFGGDHANPRDGAWSGQELEDKMNTFKKNVIASLQNLPGVDTKSKVEQIEKIFNFEERPDHEGKMHPWAFHLFDHVPVAGVQTILSKLQSDVKAVESDILAILYSQVDAADFKVNKFEPVVIMNKSLFAPGDSVKAKIVVAAYDSTKQNSKYLITGKDGRELTAPEELKLNGGVGVFRKKVSGTGDFAWQGVVEVEDPLGGTQSYPFEVNYKSSNLDAVIDPSKMNVLYQAVDNPIAVSVPGVNPNDISLQISGSGFKIKKVKAASFEIKPSTKTSTKKPVTVSVFAKDSNGKNRKFGEKEFRIKPLPSPSAEYMDNDGSEENMSLNILRSGNLLKAEMGEDFLFDGIKWKVSKFKITIEGGGDPVVFNIQGNRITPDAKQVLSSIRKGARVTFSNILADGPGGSKKKLRNLSFKAI